MYTRLAAYNATVLPCGLYTCQTRNISAKDMAAMEAVHAQILRRVFRLNPRTLARGKSGSIAPIECRIRQSQLRYYGHVFRKSESYPIRRTVRGVQKIGRNYECWQSVIEMAGELFGINVADDILINDIIQ